MTALAWIAIGAGVAVAVLFWVVCLCVMASRADDQLRREGRLP